MPNKRKRRQRMLSRAQRVAEREQLEKTAEQLLADLGPGEVQRRHDVMTLEKFHQGLSDSPVLLADFYTDGMVEDFEGALRRQFHRLTGKELTRESATRVQEDAEEGAELRRESEWIRKGLDL